jgi:GT2 family glycosyltransferase
MLDLAVIIVTWNVRDLVVDALNSLFSDLTASGLQATVYVIDSASSDGTAQAISESFPDVRLTASQENLGFTAANNLALQKIGFGEQGGSNLPRAVYLLNPDTITHAGACRALFDALMNDDSIGMVGARLTYDDGSFQHSAFSFPGLRQLWVELFPTPGRLIESRFNGRYPRAKYEQGEPFLVDFTLGATMMLKSEVIQQIGLLDQQTFFMYCEEIDWAWRMQKAGWKVQCVPTAHVTHLGGQSSSQARPQSVVNLWTSRLRLFQKHYPVWKCIVARRMVAVGMQRKIQQARAKGDPAELIAAYEQVKELAASS